MKSSKKMTVAIIIPTFNREEVLCDTLKSVMSLDPYPDEVIVVDQSKRHNKDTEKYLLYAQSEGVKLINLSEPGVCYARNLGGALSNSDILVFIDDDVQLHNKKFVEMHRNNYLDDKVDAVWGQILHPGQSTTSILGRNNIIPQNYSERVENIKYLISANHSIKRNIFIEAGGYDEGFSGRTYANEDGDFGMRLYNNGYRIDFDPLATLIHLQAPSGGNRITGRDNFPEWTRSVTFFQYAFRHYKGLSKFRELIRVFRIITFRKENVVEFWNIPSSVIHTLYGLYIAIIRFRGGFKSSLFHNGVHQLRKQHFKITS